MKMLQKFLSLVAVGVITTSLAHAAPGQRSDKNIVEIAVSNENFTTLVAAVSAAGLVDALSAPGPLTVFAPTNAAFAKLPAGTVEALLADIPALTNVLTYHVVGSEKSPRALVQEKFVKTLQGTDVKISLNGSMQLRINDSLVVMKLIDAVLLP